MMNQLQQNIEYVHGDDAIFTGTVMLDGAVVDPTGCSFWFTVKVNTTDADTGVYQLTSAGGAIVVTDGPNGQIQLTIPADQTYVPAFSWKDTVYNYDLQMKDTSNKISTLAKGKVTVLADVTRAT